MAFEVLVSGYSRALNFCMANDMRYEIDTETEKIHRHSISSLADQQQQQQQHDQQQEHHHQQNNFISIREFQPQDREQVHQIYRSSAVTLAKLAKSKTLRYCLTRWFPLVGLVLIVWWWKRRHRSNAIVFLSPDNGDDESLQMAVLLLGIFFYLGCQLLSWCVFWKYLKLSTKTLNGDLHDISAKYLTPHMRSTFLVASLTEEGTLAGFVALQPLSEHQCEVVRITVDESFRRRGVATALLRALEVKAREFGYTQILVSTSSLVHDFAQQFFVKHGFIVNTSVQRSLGVQVIYSSKTLNPIQPSPPRE